MIVDDDPISSCYFFPVLRVFLSVVQESNESGKLFLFDSLNILCVAGSEMIVGLYRYNLSGVTGIYTPTIV